MVRMARVTVLFVFLLNITGYNFLNGVRIGRRKIEVIHKGRPLQDLVVLDSQITPHDLEYLNAFVKPKLLEDSKAEGMMLQKNGIEDFRPLDVTMDTDEDPSDNQQYENGIDQFSVSDNSNKNRDYDLKSMPEYNLETKADFKANQEAIDWMMKDPNDFNVKSYEDSSVLEDTHKEDQDETEHHTHSHLHHRNYGSKRHHGTSLKDSSVQDYDHDADNTQSQSNEISTGSNKHRHGETTEFKDNDNDKDNDIQNSEDSEEENSDYSQKSWDNIGDNVDDGTINARYDNYNRDSEDDIENSPRETSMKTLNQRIKNQDAKLFKELDNFQNIDDNSNIDDSNDILGSFDEQRNEFGNAGEQNENMDNRDDSNSDDEDNISNSNERKADEKKSENGYETESERENENENESESENESETENENKNKNYSEGEDDNESESETKNQSSLHTSDQPEKENKDEDTTESKSNNRMSNNNNNNEDNNGAVRDKEDDKDDKDKERETAKANDIGSDQNILNIKAKHVNANDKLKEITEEKTDNLGKHKAMNQNTNNSLTGKEDESYKSLEEKITNEVKEVMSDLSNSKRLEETTIDSKSEHEKHVSTDNVGNEEGTKVTSSTVEIGERPKSEKEGLGNRKLVQDTNISTKNDKGHLSTQNVGNDEEIVTASSNTENGKHSSDTDTSTEHSNSDTNKEDVSNPKYYDQRKLVITTDEPLLNDKQQPLLQKGKEMHIKMKMDQNSETKPHVAFKRPALMERIKARHHTSKMRNDYRKGKRPTIAGFRRNQPIYGPSSSTFSLADALKIQNIVSYLRGTATPSSLPTKSPSYRSKGFSLKSLYFYPMHPTPQEQTDGTSATKDLTFSEWNDWSTCSVTCGKGTSVRARVCLITSCPQKDLFQTNSCQKSICADDLERESLEEHNELRAKHFSPPLLWSHALTRKAQKIAQSLAAKDFLTLDDLQEPQGESLAQIQYTDQHVAKKAVDKWYSEIKSYSFSYPKISPKTRHFVQIVWKETKEMGLAVAKSPNGNYAFVVALYNPPIIDSNGHLRQNVLRPGMKNDLYSTIRR